MPITYQDAITKYVNVQGNIIKSHGRDHAAFLFIDFGDDQTGARQWIANLLTGTNSHPKLTSASQQLRDTLLFKSTNGKQGGGLVASLLLTADGYCFFAAPLPQEEPNQAPFAPRADAFEQGMRTDAARTLLKDPKFSEWDSGWLATDGAPTAIHAMLLLADDKQENVAAAVQAAEASVGQFGGQVRIQEHGNVIRNANTDGIEHFGYADGISQPVFLTEDVEPTVIHPLDTELEVEELALVADAFGSFGSFFVFRKLAQDVAGFKDAEHTIGEQLAQQAQALGVPFTNDAGAMLVGRQESGHPAVLLNRPFVRPITNNFDYSADTAGLQCPFHAHTRKMNPRTETTEPRELRHRLTRRGIPYGKVGEKEVGLLFMCYQRNVSQQFEFIQTRWANNAGFLQAGTGLDPIIGQGSPRPAISIPFEWDKAPSGSVSFDQFVHLRGGEYFYAPSMSGLAALAGVAKP